MGVAVRICSWAQQKVFAKARAFFIEGYLRLAVRSVSLSLPSISLKERYVAIVAKRKSFMMSSCRLPFRGSLSYITACLLVQ